MSKLEGHKGRVFGLSVSHDGLMILTGGDTTLILWDSTSYAQTRRYLGHTALLRCVALLPDGTHAVSSSADKTIRLWDAENGREVRQFGDNKSEPMWLAVSPDGQLLLSSHRGEKAGLRLWDLETGELLQEIPWPANSWDRVPTRGSFARDGVHAVWGTGDGHVKVYRLTESGMRSPSTATGTPSAVGTAGNQGR